MANPILTIMLGSGFSINRKYRKMAIVISFTILIYYFFFPFQNSEETEKWLSIDQENFELKAMHVTLLPKRISLFCPVEPVGA